MKPIYNFLICFLVSFQSFTQEENYKNVIRSHQDELNEKYKNAEESPLKTEDLQKFKGHDFFEIDSTYRVVAQYEKLELPIIILMKTSTSRLPEYIVYAKATFELKGKSHELVLYKSKSPPSDPEYLDYLFLPFTDLTNGEETYDVGRYIDIKIPDGDTVVIDFNKSYNPYCAYNKGYSCPIPPEENHLNVKIKAGILKPDF